MAIDNQMDDQPKVCMSCRQEQLMVVQVSVSRNKKGIITRKTRLKCDECGATVSRDWKHSDGELVAY